MSLSSQLAVARREFTVEVDLDVAAETLVIVGPSGCGKTTVLRALAGLLAPDRARIRLDGRLLHDTEQNVTLPPERRQIGVVFQNYALFPHLDVARNLAYGLGATPRADRDRRVRVAMQRVRITHLARSRPAQLSGGEQQRVAVARALITEPRLLLLDEPLSALDIDTRTSVRRELAVLLRELAIPTIVVTHDLRDAEVLADRIAVMDRGRIVQIGTPTEVTTHPVNAFLAQFTGTNLIPATLLDPDAAPDTVLAVDPAQIRLTRPHAGDRSGWATTITTLQPRGSTVRVGLSIPPDTVAELPAEQAQAMRLAVIIGVPTVPIGIYTRQILAKANNIYGPGFSDQVLGHVVSTETDVKQVLHKVALDEADAGIVYRTDVTPQLATQLRVIDIPAGLQVNAINYIAVPVHAPHPAAAHQLLDYLLSAPGQAVFTHFGYLPLTTPATTAAPSPPPSRGAHTPGG